MGSIYCINQIEEGHKNYLVARAIFSQREKILSGTDLLAGCFFLVFLLSILLNWLFHKQWHLSFYYYNQLLFNPCFFVYLFLIATRRKTFLLLVFFSASSYALDYIWMNTEREKKIYHKSIVNSKYFILSNSLVHYYSKDTCWNGCLHKSIS